MSLSRLSALLSTLALLQLTLLGGETRCATYGGVGAMRMVAGARARMTMPRPHHARDVAGAVTSRADDGDDACGATHGHAACASMPSCSVSMLLPRRSLAMSDERPATTALPEPSSSPAEHAAGPSVPPPRA